MAARGNSTHPGDDLMRNLVLLLVNRHFQSMEAKMPKTIITLSIAVVLLLACANSGCQSVDHQVQPLSLTKPLPPTFSFDPGTPALQKRGGITMRLEIVSVVSRRAVEEKRENEIQLPVATNSNGQQIAPPETRFELVETPRYVLDPPNMMLVIKITNQLGHTLRMSESVLTLNVSGQLVRLAKSDYAEFSEAIIPRGQEQEVPVKGPGWDTLPDSGTLRIAIDDVVVAVDESNRATKREHFEWIVTYHKESTTTTDEVRRRFKSQTGQGDIHDAPKLQLDRDNPLVKKVFK